MLQQEKVRLCQVDETTMRRRTFARLRARIFACVRVRVCLCACQKLMRKLDVRVRHNRSYLRQLKPTASARPFCCSSLKISNISRLSSKPLPLLPTKALYFGAAVEGEKPYSAVHLTFTYFVSPSFSFFSRFYINSICWGA